MDFPWYGYIAIIGVIGWAAMVIIGARGYSRSKDGNAKANEVMDENIATNKAVLAKLDSIESRLGVVEKTLTDIQ
ncbi:hypothetical protein BH11ACT5_BH11ACT5_05670 [soil metagenome]